MVDPGILSPKKQLQDPYKLRKTGCEGMSATRAIGNWMGEPPQDQGEPVYKQTGHQTNSDQLPTVYLNHRSQRFEFSRILPWNSRLCKSFPGNFGIWPYENSLFTK